MYTIYQTTTRLYVVRHAREAESGAEEWRVLKIDRTSAELEAAEDCTAYTRPQIQRLLATIHAGNQTHGGLQTVCEAHAIIGSLRFLEGPYLLLVTRRRHLGALCGHKVFGIEATALLPVLSPAAHKHQFGSSVAATAEVRYRKLLAGVQLSKDFFYSDSWPLHQTVQRTFAQAPDAWAAAAAAPWASPRVWNAHLAAPLRAALGDASRWVAPLCHGYFEQRPLALLGRTLQLTLIARRSRQFAGTRYLKRGVTEGGHCANDVEVEQVVEAGVDWKSGQPLLSSVVQVRGSIPLPWAQRPDSSVGRPEIVLHRFDPLYAATRRHFDQLREQYGEPVCVLDLVKRVERRPRESVLGCEYAAAVRFLNQRLPPGQQRVQYTAFDLSHRAKAARGHLLSDLQRLQEPVLHATGIFASGARGSGRGSAGGGAGGAGAAAAAQRAQHGVLRTNCIDSLDRTNVAQFSYGMLALGQQLHALGIAESAWLDPASSMARHLMDMWERSGHTLALQYGGSEAHAAFFQRQRGDWEAATQGRDLLTTVRRFYSNAWTDADKQGAINLFLGTFVPAPGRPHLWELGGDAHLHAGSGRSPARAASVGERASFADATAAAAAAGAADLASFPPPLSPEVPPAPPMHGRLGSPRAVATAAAAESEGLEAPPLGESLSVASLVSLSSDGSFAPTLSALMDGASQQPLRALVTAASAEPEVQGQAASGAGDDEEPTTPRAGQQASAVGAAAAAGGGAPAAPAAAGGSPLPRPGVRRSPLLKRAAPWVEAKLESFDQMLGRQPVAHVRLTAPPPPTKQSPLGGWLSPSKPAQQAQQGGRPAATGAAPGGSGSGSTGHAHVGVPAPGAAAAAAAAATVEAAGVAEAGPGVPLPANGLRRSNSDPSLASSLGAAALAVPAPPAVAPGGVGRRVTFGDAAPAALTPRAPAAAAPAAGPPGSGAEPPAQRRAAGPGGLRRRSTGSASVPHSLQRHSTAPTSCLEELVDVAAAAAAAGGLGHPFGSSLAGQLLLVEGSPDGQLTWSGSYLLAGGGGGAGLQQRSSSAGYHSLAGLNLEGAAAAEAGMWQQGPAPAPASAAAATSAGKSSRRIISFPSLARLRSLGRKPSSAAVGGNGGGEPPAPPPSLLQPSLPAGGGAPEPLSMSAVVFGAEAVRRGVDTLGLPPAAPAWWLTGVDPLAAMLEEQQRLRSQIAQQREALATPLDPVEQRALLEQCASLMRPAWALNLSSFEHPQEDAQPSPAPPPAVVPPRPPPAQQQVPRQGLAF